MQQGKCGIAWCFNTNASPNSRSLSPPQELERKFENYGKVVEARVVRNPATGESRGFGFVALDHDDEVDEVRHILDSWSMNYRCPLGCQLKQFECSHFAALDRDDKVDEVTFLNKDPVI